MQGKRLDPGNNNKNTRTGASESKVNNPIPKDTAQKEAEQRVEKRAHRKKMIYRAIVAVLAVLLALLISVAAWWKIFIQRPTVPEGTGNNGSLADPNAPEQAAGGRKDEFFTFLVIGRDTGGGGNTDTILLASYDLPNQKLNVMSIPRDTMVNVPWEIKRINSVYNYYGAGDEGIKALDEEVSQLVGFVPDFQIVLEWKAVGELVDALGGVRFHVPQDMYYSDPTQNLTINVKKGDQLLDGKLAMQVVRFRSYPNGDLGRIEVQQAFLKEVVKSCLKIENMTRLNDLIKVFNDNVTTNLTINELAWLADKAIFGGLRTENVNFFTMPNGPASIWSSRYQNYQSYVVPVEGELVELVNLYLNPYREDLDTHELDIMTVKDGKISSSTGKLEDPNINSYHKPAMSNSADIQQPGGAIAETNSDAGGTGGAGDMNAETNAGEAGSAAETTPAQGGAEQSETPPQTPQQTPPQTPPQTPQQTPPQTPQQTPPEAANPSGGAQTTQAMQTPEGGAQEIPAA